MRIGKARFFATVVILLQCVMGGNSIQAAVDGRASPVHQRLSSTNTSPLAISLGVDGVADQVEHEPHRAEGGFFPIEDKPRYVAGRLGLRWSPTQTLDVQAGLNTHTISSKRDRYRLDSWHVSVRQDLPLSFDSVTLSFGLSAGSNHGRALTKTSYTRYNGWLVTRASLQQPRDRHWQANLFAEQYLNDRLHALAYIGLGRAISENDGFDGVVENDERCRFAVSLNEYSNTVSLLEPCGQIQSLNQQFPSREAFEARYGFDTESDFIGNTRYWQLGAQLAQSNFRSHYGLGYHFQYFDRGQLDKRLEDRGGKPLVINHSMSLWWHYRFAPRWTLESGAEYSLRPMLNRLHVLYTGFTSERFSTSALLLNLSLRYTLF